MTNLDWREKLLKQLDDYKADRSVALLMQFEWAIAEDRLRVLRGAVEEVTDCILTDGNIIKAVPYTPRGLMGYLVTSSEPLSEWHEYQIDDFLQKRTQRQLAWHCDTANRKMYAFAFLIPTDVKEVLTRNDLICAAIDDRDPKLLLEECFGHYKTARRNENNRWIYEKAQPYFDRLNAG